MMRNGLRRLFTKAQVLGIVVIAMTVVGCILVLHLLPKGAPETADSEALALSTEAAQAIEERLQDLETVHDWDKQDVARRMRAFDPNTVDSVTLRALVFSHWMARNLLHYRAKGGVFRKGDDMRRLYGMNDSLFATLQPYIQIDSTHFTERDNSFWAYDTTRVVHALREKKDTVLELNAADTASLQLIRGIGRYSAVKIVQYRRALGGYVSVEQLREIQELPTVEDSLFRYFTVCVDSVQRLPINKCTVERLNRHPYLSFTQAKAIYTLRRERVRLSGMDDLRSVEELTERDLRRIEPYLDFQP